MQSTSLTDTAALAPMPHKYGLAKSNMRSLNLTYRGNLSLVRKYRLSTGPKVRTPETPSDLPQLRGGVNGGKVFRPRLPVVSTP